MIDTYDAIEKYILNFILLIKFLYFQKDPINGLMFDPMSSEVNEDDEKILNPLKPQKNFGKKNKNKNY